ncbi:MAG: VWA domain-containing protein [Oscillospiraceae bacterium]|nr:VWA domain-containing protein [Oscillospiraceae bacterium]
MNDQAERVRRWRLLLGAEAGLDGEAPSGDAVMEAAMNAVYGDRFSYDPDGTGQKARGAARWMRDIRACFPEETVGMMVGDAADRHDIESLLLQPEALKRLPRDVHTAALLLRYKRSIPASSAALAREIVASVAEDIRRGLEPRLRSAVSGAANRRHSPSSKALDWHGTIRKNLRRYDADRRTITPDKFLFFARDSARAEIILALDRSASMIRHAVTAAAAAAALSEIPSVRIRLFAFDTAVTELTEQAGDPAEVLFRLRFTGGTDIANAVGFCQRQIARPGRTALILITDLHDSGNSARLIAELEAVLHSGVPAAVLLPGAHNRPLARELAARGALCAAIEPDAWPETVERLLS